MNKPKNKIAVDKRFKKRSFFRINENGKIQFSDTYSKELGYIGKVYKEMK